MSAHEQVAWFINGCTPEMKRQCATQPDGSEWQTLDALAQFAIGVETRNEVAAAYPTPTPASKRPRLAAASMPASYAKQGRGNRATQSKAKGTPDKPKGTQKAKSKGGNTVPGRLKGLWAATQKNGWSDEDGHPYTEASWLATVRGGKCVICHKPRNACLGHARPAGGGAGGAAAI